MSRYNLGVRTTDGTTTKPCLEIIAGIRPCVLMELSITLVAATATELGIGVPAAKGITPTSPVAPVGQGDPNAVMCRVAVAWGTGPTVPAAFMRRIQLPAAIGASWLYDFDDFKSDKPNGIVIPALSSLVIWNISTSSVLDVSMILEEKWA